MTRALPIFAVLAVLAGCTTYKFWTESDSDQQAGTISISYEFRRFENPQVDDRAATTLVRERCADWGFRQGATREGEARACIDGTNERCNRWRVTREYRCVREAAR